ncbi:universal stress protein [Pelomicrobium sp. G1]|uniref:universal stress protein n=1 Tax=unclassified Pelomicrobium TaxID=2815318 RepID=UPI003F757843
MYQRIFVPIDGSPASSAALAEAIGLSKKLGAAMRLAHVYESLRHTGSEGFIDLTERLKEEGKFLLAEAQKRCAESGVEADTVLVDAAGRRIATAIVEEAARWGAQLIVMGTHGRHGFEHLILGSVAEGVVRRAATPVLLIRAR